MFLGAPHWENSIVGAFDCAQFSDDLKKIILQKFLGFLQKPEPLLAQRYASDVFSYAYDQDSKSMISLTNAPAWLLEGTLHIK